MPKISQQDADLLREVISGNLLIGDGLRAQLLGILAENIEAAPPTLFQTVATLADVVLASPASPYGDAKLLARAVTSLLAQLAEDANLIHDALGKYNSDYPITREVEEAIARTSERVLTWQGPTKAATMPWLLSEQDISVLRKARGRVADLARSYASVNPDLDAFDELLKRLGA